MYSFHKTVLFSFLFILFAGRSLAGYTQSLYIQPAPRSTKEQALQLLHTQRTPDSSIYWPHVRPSDLVTNLDLFITDPLLAFENKNTNFCGYTAISFAAVRHDPAGLVRFMLELYQKGEAKMGTVEFKPSKRVRQFAGKLKYKGMLDVNPATQMLFLSLGDRFKGYLNIVNMRFDEGDENTLWSSTNYAKFNRMLKRLFGWKVKGRGADLSRPKIDDMFGYITKRMQTGMVYLYLNNRLLYKKNHVVVRVGMPTHFVLLTELTRTDDFINITYMDGSKKTLQQVSPDFLRKIVYGISYIPAN